MNNEKEDPVENAIEKVSSPLVWTAKVLGSRAGDRVHDVTG